MTRLLFAGDCTVDFLARDFSREGYEVRVLPGFGAWRQDFLNPEGETARFRPDAVLAIDLKGGEWGRAAAKALGCPVFFPPLETLESETPGFRDPKMEALAGFPFSLAGLRAIEDEFRWFLWPLISCEITSRAKILALDADGTLWRGVASEDGSVAANEPLQEAALRLKARGVGLILLSKNEAATVESALAGMVLSPDDFLCFGAGVNWEPKAANLRKICAKLNVGADAVVFLDDSPFEREQMRALAPEVAIPPCGAEELFAPATARRLETYFFPAATVTQEDLLRNASYAADGKRETLRQSIPTEEEFLASLEMRIAGSLAAPEDIPRLAQLAARANQFNATTIRRTESDFASLLADASARVFAFRVSDKFGDLGLVAFAVARRSPADATHWRITDFAMSCRAMGRRVEDFALEFVRRAIAEAGGALAGIDFVPTARNKPFADWLARVQTSTLSRTKSTTTTKAL